MSDAFEGWDGCIREGTDMKQPGDDDCDEEIDEPTDKEVARRYVEEHGRRDEDGE